MSTQITRSIIVKAEPQVAFSIWKDFQNFPHFMKYIQSVRKTGPDTSEWELDGPLGKTVHWEAEITRLDPNKRIAWSTKDRDGGTVTTSGQVTFNDLPQNETEVTVMMQYEPAGGVAGDLVAKLFAKPEAMLEQDLQNFKNYVEGMHNRTAG